MRTVGRRALWGAVIGLVLVTIFAMGTFDDQEGVPWAVRLILALAMGGLPFGALPGAIVGGIVGVVRSRRGRATPVPPTVPRPAVTAGPDAGEPWSVQPQPAHPGMSERVRETIRAPAAAQSRGTVAAQPVPLAPIRPAPVRAEPEKVSTQDPERLNRVLDRLDGLVGLESVADQVRRTAHRVLFEQEREKRGLPASDIGMHCVFTGPSGVAKTTVARLWGEVLCALGLLPSDLVVEVDRGDLVGQHVGATAQRTMERLREAEGGTLFLDEAYTLTPEVPGNDFGAEAVATILKHMEDHRSSLCVIVAGYADQMERFLGSNPGLASRFSNHVEFPAYDAGTLVTITERMAAEGKDTFTPEAMAVLRTAYARLVARPPGTWANGRSARDLLDATRTARASRLAGRYDMTDKDFAVLTQVDVQSALQAKFPQAL